MKYTLHQNLSDKKGVISNTHGFLSRSLDTGFKTKWSGYWVPDHKFLDYFSFKINGVWLNNSTLRAVEYGEEMIFHHETDSLIIHEIVEAPESFPGLKVQLEIENKTDEKKAIQAVLEAGIDIRPKDEDLVTGEYDLEREKNRVIASRLGKKLVIEAENPSGFTGDNHTKEHFPGEKQICLVPEKPVYRREVAGDEKIEIEVSFKTSKGSFRRLEKTDNSLDHELGRCFKSSINSLENMVYGHKGGGIIAGHPWFQNYWARDSFWSVPGLIDSGYFDTSQKILENFARKDLPDKISPDSAPEDDEVQRSDAAPLFIIASEKLRLHDSISKEIEEGRKNAMSRLEMEDKVVKHSPDGTWMDTLEREKAIDIQSLWLEAARIMNDPREERLGAGLEKFNSGDKLQDELGGGSNTVNPAVPLIFGQLDQKTAERELERINGEFSSRYGARTRSVTDPGYDSSGYHTGSVWGLTTCWAAAANFHYGKDQEGYNFLEKISQFLDRNQPGALPEVVDAESGELLGTPEQAWSAGMFVHVIDSYLLGIKVEENHVKIDPAENLSCKRTGKKIRGERLDLEIKDGKATVLNDPKLNLRL